MNQEIEIEFKNLVTEAEFQALLTSFSIYDDSFTEQTNYYFDTEDFSLRDKGCALRIRQKQGKYTFTLKQPQKDGLLESHEPLSKESADQFISGEELESSEMLLFLEETYGIRPNQLFNLGALVTLRAEIPYKSGLLVFDHSKYLGTEDYEIEFEVNDHDSGQKEFNQLLEEFNIPTRLTPNKIKRFFDYKR